MRDITLCHPRLQHLAGQLIEECGRQGLSIKIGETFRTVAEQDALFAQGRTKPGNIVTNAPGSNYSSYHQWGTAFDIFRNDGAGTGNPLWIIPISSCRTGEVPPVESKRYTPLRRRS